MTALGTRSAAGTRPAPVGRPGPGPERVRDVADFVAHGRRTARALVGGDAPDTPGPEHPWYPALWHALGEASRGGSRVRPRLLLTAYRALGGEDEAAAGHVAEAVELLHSAFVIHDDVIDHDAVRRGRPNVSGTFETLARSAGGDAEAAGQLGATAGILAGDLALVGAVAMVARTPAPGHVVGRLLDLVEDAVRVTAAGELEDVRFGLGIGTPSLTQVLATEERKTAAYSFALPLQAAAVLVDTAWTLAVLEDLGRIGALVGTAFQLADDLLGTFGDPALTGKSTLSDLREGKVTALIAHARDTTAWPVVAAHLGDPELSEEDADTVRAALETCGAREFVEGLVTAHLAGARETALRAGLPGELVAALTDVTR